MRALLVSTYELGHQPFGLASPVAWLKREGVDVRTVDVAKERLTDEQILGAEVIAFHLAMHTATRLAAPLITKARALNASARICAYGLYAPLNEDWLRSLGVDEVLGGEFEEQLAAFAIGQPLVKSGVIAKLQFLPPDRSSLPPLSRYATLRLGDGTERVVGYTEGSRGCRHLCRHCPVVPVYEGQFRIVQRDVVMKDVAALVEAGAQHITFGDPDFFNGPTHAMRLVDDLHRAHPDVTYDATIKIEHLLGHRALLPRLAETGCLFVTSAVESLDDRVLAILDKGHTRADFFEAVSVCRAAGVTLVPTFVAFHPWLTLEDYCDLIDTLAALNLVDHVAPIQLAIRLLVPQGSRLLEVEGVRGLVGAFDPRTLTFRWQHRDARVDRLQEEIAAVVGARLSSGRREVFHLINCLAHERAGTPPCSVPAASGPGVPYLSEPWYCCAEPNPEQLTLV